MNFFYANKNDSPAALLFVRALHMPCRTSNNAGLTCVKKAMPLSTSSVKTKTPLNWMSASESSKTSV